MSDRERLLDNTYQEGGDYRSRILEEEDEDEYQDKPVERIKGDYNIEIPEIVHNLFLFCEAREVVKMTRVSKTFRNVGTTDLLWKHILKNLNEYIPETSVIAKTVFFYDVKNSNEDLYPKMMKKFHKAYDRRVRIRKKQNRDKIKKYTKDSLLSAWEIFLWTGTIITTFLFPPLGTIGQGVLAARKVYWSDEVDEYGILFAATICDTICCFFFVSFLTLLGFLPGVFCASFNFLVGVGRLYRRMGDDEYMYLLSPSILCVLLTAIILGLCLGCCACMCTKYCVFFVFRYLLDVPN